MADWASIGVVSVPIKIGPAYVNNNLSRDGESVAYTTGKDVCFVKEKSFDGKSGSLLSYLGYSSKHAIYQAKFSKFGGISILVLATSRSIEFWSEESSKCILSYPLPDAEEDDNFGKLVHIVHQSGVMQPSGRYASGICSLTTTKGDQLVAVGSSSGRIYVFSVQRSLVTLERVLKAKSVPITSLATQGKADIERSDTFIATHGNGCVVLWNLQTDTNTVLHDLDSTPCTTSAIWGDLQIVGFADGKIRLFRNERLVTEVAAHAKAITAICVHPERALLASVSEDTYVTVWSLPIAQEISVNTTTSVSNSLLCGVQFCGKKNNELAVTFYDGDIICVWAGK